MNLLMETRSNQNALINYLVKQKVAKQKRIAMLEASKTVDELNLGWDDEEEYGAIIDTQVSG